MKHRCHRKYIKRINKRFKRVAAAMAGAAIMSSVMLPGVPAAVAHASANPNTGNPPVTASEKLSDINPIRIPVRNPVQPDTNAKKLPVKTPQPARRAKGMSNARQRNPNAQKAPAGSEAGIPENYKQVLDIKATAYAPGPHDNDQWGDKTFLGTQIRPGVVAVDPSIIPLGSRVYIQYPDGHGEYAVAEDTGGAIKGNRIDIAMRTVSKAEDFGIQNVKVYVIDTPQNA